MVLAVGLFVESHRRTQRTHAIAWLAGIAAIALLFRFQWEVWFLVPLLFGARLEIADNILTARAENGPELRFNITEAAHELANPLSNEHRPLRLNASSRGLTGVLLIDNLNGTLQGAKLRSVADPFLAGAQTGGVGSTTPRRLRSRT